MTAIVTPPFAPACTPVFAPETLRRQPWQARLFHWFFTRPEWLLRPLRCIRPFVGIGGTLFVLRHDDVREVLARDDVFAVPFGRRIAAVDRSGQNFILGMDSADPRYRPELARLMRVMPHADLPRLGAEARDSADAALRRAGPEFDIVGGLFTPTTTHIVARYFGVAASDLALWAMALSNWIFATPYGAKPAGEAVARQAALAAGAALGTVTDAAIAEAVSGTHAHDTLAARLVRDVLAGTPAASLADVQDAVRPVLDSLITAFVPNCTVAATNILGVLLDRPDIQARCRAIAADGDDAALGRALMEAFRFRPLFPGPTRICGQDYVLAADAPHARRIRAGTMVLACCQSAMFDADRIDRPHHFDPDRAASDSLLFGYGLHGCIGTALASTQLVNIFRPLLLGPRFRRVAGARGRMAYFGAFPEHLIIRFDR